MEALKYDPDRKWIIEVTEQQLYDIINDVEDIHRFLAGQMDLWNATNLLEPIKTRLELRDKLRELQEYVTPLLTRGASYDWAGTHCSNEAQKSKIKRDYAIYRNLRHCLTKYFDTNDWNVYKRETLTCGVPLAICYPKKDTHKKTYKVFYKVECEGKFWFVKFRELGEYDTINQSIDAAVTKFIEIRGDSSFDERKMRESLKSENKYDGGYAFFKIERIKE